MSFNRSGYIGRAPGDSSIVLAKQYFQPTGAGKTFTFTAGYDPGLLDVYRNGVKLINVLDYAATDGSTIVLDTPVGVGSTVQVVAYKGFNLAEVNSSGADFNVGTNLYVQSGFGSFAQGITANQINVTGIGTITRLNTTDTVSTSSTITRLTNTDFVGTSATITRLNATNAVVSGVMTATSFSGVGQVGVASEGTFLGAGASMLNFASSNGTAIAVDPAETSGIATITITPGASLGLAIALGG